MKKLLIVGHPKTVSIAAGVVALIAALGLWSQLRRASAIENSPATKAAEPVNVQVTSPERHDITRQVAMPASIEAFEQTVLYAKTAGYLKWIKVDIGDRVRKGEVIAEIDVPEMAPEYRGSEAEVERAKANIGNMQA